MPTKGYKTTEFWLSLAAILLGAIMASGALDGLGQDSALVKIVGILASVLGALGYTVQRGFVKSSGTAAVSAIAAASVPVNPPEPPKP